MTLGTLFILGFWICVAMAVFSLGVHLVMWLIWGVCALVVWVFNKITGRE